MWHCESTVPGIVTMSPVDHCIISVDTVPCHLTSMSTIYFLYITLPYLAVSFSKFMKSKFCTIKNSTVLVLLLISYRNIVYLSKIKMIYNIIDKEF